jgi:cobalt transporter subunit CbtA
MDSFRRVFLAALCAGTLSGLLITVVHQAGTVPIILQSEIFERAAETPDVISDFVQPSAGSHVAHEHSHEGTAWEPEDGLERILYTGIADVLTGIGFALLLVSAYTLRKEAMDWRRGLCWGLAGFVTFTLSPSLGLPPELPGTQAAPLLDRQIWWVTTALLTGSGLGMVIFMRQATWRVFGVALIALPHMIGAPQQAEHVGLAPEALTHQFVVVATVTSLVFWVCLGTSTGYLFRRFHQDV